MCPVTSHCWTHQRLAKSLAILSPSWHRRCKDELQSYPFQLRRRWQSDSASHWICGLLHPCWSTPLCVDGSVGTFEVWLMYGVSVSFECYDYLWTHDSVSFRRTSEHIRTTTGSLSRVGHWRHWLATWREMPLALCWSMFACCPGGRSMVFWSSNMGNVEANN